MLLSSQRKNWDQQSRKRLETMGVTEQAENRVAVCVLRIKAIAGM
jgi:hypothetical protein